MEKEYLLEYKQKLLNLTDEEKIKRDLYLKRISLGEIYGPNTGFSSIDKPWLRYYKDEYIKAPLPYMSAINYLEERNKNNKDLIAIDSAVGTYTYGELFDEIDKTAASLYKIGVKKGSVVLTMIPILPHETFLFYGADKVGAAISLLPALSPNVDPNMLVNSINEFNSEHFFIFDYFLTPELEQIIYQKTNVKNIVVISFNRDKKYDSRTISWEEFYNLSNDYVLPEIKRNPEDVLFIAKTGGSTGEPKNVLLNDNSFNIIVHQFINSDVNYNVGDKWIRLWLLFSASAAVANHHLPLALGMNNLLRPFPQDMTVFDKMILDDKPNHIVMIPQLLDVLESSELLKNEDLSFIKTAGCGGMAITSDFEERVNEYYKKHNVDTFLGYGWGCTEHCSNVAMRSNFETTTIGTVGAPMVKTIVATFDPETMEELPIGQEGELCVNSKTIMMGYYNDKELTNKVIKKHNDGTIWLHTGDSGVVDENGLVTVKGRITRLIFVFPTDKIYPAALENLISKVPGVREVVVCQAPDEEHDGFNVPICFIVPDKDYDYQVVRQNVSDLCDEAFPEHARPREIYVREYLPLTKVGKPDVRTLENEFLQQKKLIKTKK